MQIHNSYHKNCQYVNHSKLYQNNLIVKDFSISCHKTSHNLFMTKTNLEPFCWEDAYLHEWIWWVSKQFL